MLTFCRNQSNVKLFLEILRSLYTSVTLDKELVQILKHMSIKFAFIHLFYIEFEKIFQYLRVADAKDDEIP